MSDELRLTRSEQLATSNSNEHEARSNLFEEAWHSFRNQSTQVIIAEVAIGAAVVALAARGLWARSGKQAIRLAPAEGLGAESSTIGGSIFARTETGIGAKLSLPSHIDAGVFPANSRDLRAALEGLSTTAEAKVLPSTVASAGLEGQGTSSLQSRLARIEETMQHVPRAKFSRIEEALQHVPKTGFPKLE